MKCANDNTTTVFDFVFACVLKTSLKYAGVKAEVIVQY